MLTHQRLQAAKVAEMAGLAVLDRRQQAQDKHADGNCRSCRHALGPIRALRIGTSMYRWLGKDVWVKDHLDPDQEKLRFSR